MVAEAAAYFAGHEPVAEERVLWPSGTELAITCYLLDELPLLDLVTSVRCIVLRRDEVLVVHTEAGPHILPGGRREPGETVEQTLRRELLEETGWTVAHFRLIGCLRLRHLTPRPDGYPFPYPEFQHLVYAAEAESYQPDRLVSDPSDGPAIFAPVEAARALLSERHERALLNAAVSRRRAGRKRGRE